MNRSVSAQLTSGSVRFALALTVLSAPAAFAEDLLLTTARSWPGTLSVSEGGTWPREIYRHVEGSRYLRGAVPRIAAVAYGSSAGTFVCSGLDGAIFKLDGNHPRLLYEHSGQVRDLAIDDGEGRLYFSVLPTPRGGESAGATEIWFFNFRTSRASRFAVIPQSAVDGDYWGTFTIRGGVLYAATLTPQGRVYRIFPGGRSELAFESGQGPTTGLTFGPSGELYYATDSAKVLRTADFRRSETVLEDPAAQFTDVAVQH
jgi:hypothetical protein